MSLLCLASRIDWGTGDIHTGLHRVTDSLQKLRLALAEVGCAQHADEVNDLLSVDILEVRQFSIGFPTPRASTAAYLEYRSFARLDEDGKGKHSARRVLSINLKQPRCLGRQSHESNLGDSYGHESSIGLY